MRAQAQPPAQASQTAMYRRAAPIPGCDTDSPDLLDLMSGKGAVECVRDLEVAMLIGCVGVPGSDGD